MKPVMRRLVSGSLAILFVVVSVIGQQPASDRTFDRFKGRVKKIVTETAELKNESGNWIEGKPLPASTETFDEMGNLVRNETYWKGQPYANYEYFFLEGARVVKVTNLGPRKEGGVGPGPKATPDSRYTWKFVFKHDSKGNRTEELCYGSDTSLRTRTVYLYDDKGNRIESTTYLPNVTHASRRTLSSYDDRGNVVDEIVYIGTNIVVKHSYTYESDSSGNWIKRKRMARATRDGKPHFESHNVDYRSITYFKE
jgi:hypothetical protein